MPTFTPTDRVRPARAPVTSPERFDKSLKDLVAVAAKMRNERLYGAVHDLAYDTPKAAALEGKFTRSEHADPAANAAIDPRRLRHRSAGQSAARDVEAAMRLLRSVHQSVSRTGMPQVP